MLETFQRKKDRSLALLHGESASSSVENAGMAYQAPSLLSAGGTAKDVALLSTATNLLFALLLVRLPSFLRSGDSLKKATIVLSIISALAWLPLILVPILVPSVPIVILISLWVISLIPALLIGPVRDKWMADLVPLNRMGSYFGLRQIVAAGSYLTTFYLMGFLLNSSKTGIQNIYIMVFSIAFLGSMLSFLLYLGVRKSESHNPVGADKFGLLDFLRETKLNNMSTFMLYVTLVTFAASISGAFFSVYMLQDLHFTYMTYTLIVSIEFLARIVSLTVWGRVVDNAGAIKLLKVISFVIPVIPVMWLFSSNLYYLGLIQVISGFSWAAFDLCNQTHICSASPESKRLHYIVYQRCVITVASAIGPLAGAFLLTRIFPVFGSPILSIFLLSGALRFIVVISLVFKLRSADSVKSDEAVVPSAVQVIYQSNRPRVSGIEYSFPKFEREQTGPGGRRLPKTPRPIAAADYETQKSGPLTTLQASPYRQAQYSAYRQAAADMVRGKTPKTASDTVLHRLSRLPSASYNMSRS